jgi:hypothetical protein
MAKEQPFKKVPTTLSAHQFRGLTNNIVQEYHDAPERMKTSGRDWYPEAHDFAGDAARHMNIPHAHASGIIAALSPGQGWGVNRAQTKQFANLKESDISALRAGDRSGLEGTPLSRQSTPNILKAQRIREGEHPDEALRSSAVKARKYVKTGNFYQNIHDPADPHPATVDTHAHDVAVRKVIPYEKDRGLDVPSRYDHFAGAYRAAAQRLQIPTANEVQAVTWNSWRERKPGGQRGVSQQMKDWETTKYKDL